MLARFYGIENIDTTTNTKNMLWASLQLVELIYKNQTHPTMKLNALTLVLLLDTLTESVLHTNILFALLFYKTST